MLGYLGGLNARVLRGDSVLGYSAFECEAANPIPAPLHEHHMIQKSGCLSPGITIKGMRTPATKGEQGRRESLVTSE